MSIASRRIVLPLTAKAAAPEAMTRPAVGGVNLALDKAAQFARQFRDDER
ncbi:MAG TPA: hypothetical protein VEL05_11375 [Candidatus Acidoferrum sp.]|nr:hypothetical protein [Candidatus Acidoferrum sp.]